LWVVGVSCTTGGRIVVGALPRCPLPLDSLSASPLKKKEERGRYLTGGLREGGAIYPPVREPPSSPSRSLRESDGASSGSNI
jgi:hypothetical protein